MSSLNVRISEPAHRVLRELSEQQGASMQSLLDEAVERLRRETFMARTNEAFAVLKSSPKAWQQEQEERALWEQTLQDGVDDK
ncbi:MAG: toxin-antitoxin system protein [Acidobacteriota bacterium]|nr:toxin-antitoxin system protein [Acidobacteriota bacterium]